MAEKIPMKVPCGKEEPINPQKEIQEVIRRRTFANPGFENKTEDRMERDSLTALDLFALPEEIMENKETFLAWFEPRFFSLKNQENFDHFAQRCRQALEILQKHPYLLSPKIKEDFPVSKSVASRISDKNGLRNLEQILGFLKKVAVENTPQNAKKFFTPDRRSVAGAERLSICRILSIAYALEITQQSQGFEKFFEYAKFVLGRTESQVEESGLLSTLIIPSGKISALEKPDGDFQFLDWMERGQTFEKCNLNNIGNHRSFYLPEVQIGTKSGLRAFLKILRDPTAELKMLTDFFRVRFVFDDKTDNQEIVELLSSLEKEAKGKKKTITQIDFREKNYFSEEEVRKYFSGQAPLVENMKVDKNPNSGEGYKNISAKIRLFRLEEKEPFFAFEIQFLRKSELENNEKIGMLSDHFVFMINQQVELLSRFNSKMEKEEIVREIKEYLETIATEKLPNKLTGRNKKAAKGFQVDFSGSLQDKARILFDFLEENGTFCKVAADFPSKSMPSLEGRGQSKFYIFCNTRDKILKNMGYKNKKEE